MSDPISISGTAVGALSLTISVCQGLISYLDDWRSYKHEVAGTLLQLDNIVQTLKFLEEFTSAPQSSHRTSGIVERHIANCASSIEELHRFWEKHCYVDPKAPFTNLRDKSKRLTFPFHKSTWEDLKSTVNTMQMSLGIALHASNL